MKKLKITIISAVIILLMTIQPIFATTNEQTIKLLGIMVGDANGNMNLEKNVTRAEFSKMIAMASIYKDAIEASNTSVFRDVKHNYWAANYINIAVNQKWFTGYVDGTFKPDNSIKLEEAAAVVLRLLGYTNDDMIGTYPNAQIAKYKSLQLDKNITKTQGQLLSRNDCMNLFINLMQTKTKAGSYYATTLGIIVNSNGELDYSSLLKTKLSKPIIVYDNTWKQAVPFDVNKAVVYKDGNIDSLSNIKNYDVVYYNADIKSIWVYSNKIVGNYTSATPNTTAPSIVTVAGNNYTLASSEATYKLSNMGDFTMGDMLTLILDMDGNVIDAVSVTKFDDVHCGVIAKNVQSVSKDGKVINNVSIACTDGTIQNYNVEANSFKPGDAVLMEYNNGDLNIKRAIVGNNKFEDYQLSDNIQIIDTNENGDFLVIPKSRLSSISLSNRHVLYYSLNSSNQINKLILKDATGDLYKYGLLTSVNEVNEVYADGTTVLQGVYKYIINGQEGVYSCNNQTLNINQAPSMFVFKDNQLSSIKNLQHAQLNTITKIYARNDSQKYSLANNVQVYLYNNNTYYLTDIDKINDISKYDLVGYYDSGFAAGSCIRIIIATPK